MSIWRQRERERLNKGRHSVYDEPHSTSGRCEVRRVITEPTMTYAHTFGTVYSRTGPTDRREIIAAYSTQASIASLASQMSLCRQPQSSRSDPVLGTSTPTPNYCRAGSAVVDNERHSRRDDPRANCCDPGPPPPPVHAHARPEQMSVGTDET